MKINFYPDNETFAESAKEYQKIWDSEGAKIIETLEKVADLKFQEKEINAVVFEGISHSHPLTLRASYTSDVKKATLVHELAHRLFFQKEKTANPLEAHKLINPVLHDSWVLLYGREFADKMVVMESERTPMYKEAWEWTQKNRR